MTDLQCVLICPTCLAARCSGSTLPTAPSAGRRGWETRTCHRRQRPPCWQRRCRGECEPALPDRGCRGWSAERAAGCHGRYRHFCFMKRDSQWALSLTCVARIPRRSDSRLRASSSRSVWNSWTPSRSELCSSRTFYKTKQITHKNTLLLTQYTLKGSGHCAAHMTLSSQHLQHNNLSESLTRFFWHFLRLKIFDLGPYKQAKDVSRTF